MNGVKVEKITWISDSLYVVRGFCGAGFKFIPGTHVVINTRNYYIGSSADYSYLTLYVRLIPGGLVSDQLHRIPIGTTLKFTDMRTFFTPGKGCTNNQYCYIAQGTGVSPFLSALTYYRHSPSHLLFESRNKDEGSLTMRFNNRINIEYAYSNDDKTIKDIMPACPIESDFQYFICGGAAMIRDASNYLMRQGIDYSQIISEVMFY